jgi:hypothetical protein
MWRARVIARTSASLKGAGGQMIAHSLRKAGLPRPATIKISAIREPNALAGLSRKDPIDETVLGRTVTKALASWVAASSPRTGPPDPAWISTTVTYPGSSATEAGGYPPVA